MKIVNDYIKKQEKNDSKLYYDFIEIIAQKASKYTIGQGIIFNSDNPKAQNTLQKWAEQNDIVEKFRKGEYITSKWGKEIYFLSPTKDKKNLKLVHVKNMFNGRVAKINEEEQAAEIWNQDFQGDNPFFSKVSITRDKIIVENFVQGEKSRVGTVETDSSPELIPLNKYEFKNIFNRLPIVEVENLPINNLYNSTMLNYRPDWLPVKNLIEKWNEAYRISNVELQANRTRILAYIQPNKLNELGANDMVREFLSDSWINVQFDNSYSSSSTGNDVNILQGDPKLDEYVKYLNSLSEMIMTGAGYSPNKVGTNETYENKTSSLFADKLDKETTDFKQSLRKPKFYKLFDCVLEFYGVKPFDENGQRIYSFDFINLAMTDTIQKIDQNDKLLASGIISPAEYRANVFNTPINLAEEQIKKVQEQLDERSKVQVELTQQDNNEDNNERLSTKDKLDGEK